MPCYLSHIRSSGAIVVAENHNTEISNTFVPKREKRENERRFDFAVVNSHAKPRRPGFSTKSCRGPDLGYSTLRYVEAVLGYESTR